MLFGFPQQLRVVFSASFHFSNKLTRKLTGANLFENSSHPPLHSSINDFGINRQLAHCFQRNRSKAGMTLGEYAPAWSALGAIDASLGHKSDAIRDGVWLSVPQPTKWHSVGNQIDAAMIFARAD
jgi:hypothetical protein